MGGGIPYKDYAIIKDQRDKFAAKCLALQEAVRQLQALVERQEVEAKDLHRQISELIRRYETPLRNKYVDQQEMVL